MVPNFLFFIFFGCNQTGDYPQEDLPNFGYRPDIKGNFF